MSSIHTRKITVTVPQLVALDDLEEMFDNIAAHTLDAVNEEVSRYFAQNHDRIARNGVSVTIGPV